MDAKPGWLQLLESGGKLSVVDLSHVKTGAGATGVIPLLAWEHMQALAAVLEQNLDTITSLNIADLRIGDVGLAALVDRVLTKEKCQIQTIDMRRNALTASGLRQAITKLSTFNYTLTTWLLEESGATDANNSSGHYSSSGSSSSSSSSNSSSTNHHSSSSSNGASSDDHHHHGASSTVSKRPGPSSTSLAKKEKEKEKDKEKDCNSGGQGPPLHFGSSLPSPTCIYTQGTHHNTSVGEPREIATMRFTEIVDKYVKEFLRLNAEAVNCMKGSSTQVVLRYTLRHPRLCPTRMAKLVMGLENATSLTIEGWLPPPPLTLKQQEKKMSKLSQEQIALKELKRAVPGTLFASLPKLTELKLVKCVRVDVEKQKKGTLRGVFSKGKSAHPATKSTFVGSIPLEIGAMPCLRRLTMAECGLDELTPAALPYMTHVEQLDFSCNEILTIPHQISSLTNVTRLFLHSNAITTVPNELSSMRYLRELWLYDNLITKVPSDLARWFPVLKDLRILAQRVEDANFIMDDPELLEYRRQEEDLIKTKSTIGCIGFLGMLKLSQASEIVLYKSSKKKK